MPLHLRESRRPVAGRRATLRHGVCVWTFPSMRSNLRTADEIVATADPLPTSTPPAAVRAVDDPLEWNRLVTTFPEHDLKQGWEWGEARRSIGWIPHRFAHVEDGHCRAAASVLVRSVPFAGALLYAPRGPLFASDDPGALPPLVDVLRGLARRTRAVVMRVSPGCRPGDTAALSALTRVGFRPIGNEWTAWNTARHAQVLDLVDPETAALRSEAAVLHGIRPRTRDYIRAAARKGLVVAPSEREADLDEFYPLLVNAARLKRFPIHDLVYFRALLRAYRETGNVLMLLARVDDALIGGLFATRLGRRLYVLHASVRGDGPSALRHYVAPALYWECMRRALAMGCERLDFGSSGVRTEPREADSGWGVYCFKKSLGCRFETFPRFHDLVFRRLAYGVFRRAEGNILPRLHVLATCLTTRRERE